MYKMRGPYKVYDPDVKKAVIESGSIKLAVSEGIPRGTAYSWINTSKQRGTYKVKEENSIYIEEILNLRKQLEIEKSKTSFIASMAKYLEIIKDGKRKIPKTVKTTVIIAIKKMLEYCTLSETLKLIGISSSKYYRWISEQNRCEVTKNFKCPVKRFNQLTADEIMMIVKTVSSKKYAHFSLTSLWKYCYRHRIIVCSKDTWFKYIKKFKIREDKITPNRNRYFIGVRAIHPNEIWHIDITEIKLIDGQTLYLQAIIDNFSRYIVAWRLSISKNADDTLYLLRQIKISNTSILYMDQGGENIARKVQRVLVGKNIKSILAKVDVKYSNSIIESFFRTAKGNFLHHKEFSSFKNLQRSLKFYVNEYNNVIPHSTFDFQTPREVYLNQFCDEARLKIMENKEVALAKRKLANINTLRCSNCVT